MRKMRVDGPYDLVIVVAHALYLLVKLIQTGHISAQGRVDTHHAKLFGEDSFDDKPAAVMFQSCLTKHLLKADILLRGEFEIIPVDSGICRCRASDPLFRGCHQAGSLSGVTRERHPASQSEHLCRTNVNLSDKGTARCCLATTKIRAGESLREVLKILRYGFHSRVCSRCNITTVSGQKKAIGADWSGLERTSEPKRFTLLYIAAGLIIRATARIAK